MKINKEHDSKYWMTNTKVLFPKGVTVYFNNALTPPQSTTSTPAAEQQEKAVT